MMIINIGYEKFALPVRDAVTVAELLQKACSWKENYATGGESTYHAYPFEGKISMDLISDDLFNMAKLAGKPEKK